MKDAAIKIRQTMLNINFNLGGRSCDSEELANLWHNTNIPDTIVLFSAELIKLSKTHLVKDINSDEIDKPDKAFYKHEFNQRFSSAKQRKKKDFKIN